MYCNRQSIGRLASSIDGIEFDSRHRKIAAGLMSALMIDAAVAQSGEIEFNITSQTASSALIAFAEQANISVVVKHNARDVSVGSLRGRFTLKQALDRILKDTGLVYKFHNNAVVVKRSLFGGGRTSMFSVISAAMLSIFSADMVYAQGPDSIDKTVDGSLVLEEVTVTGIRSSIKKALEMKRVDMRVTDGISAEDIADFPDQNLAESIQRITGVQLLRDPNTGRGSLISLRGLGPAYARTTLNGQSLAKPNLGSGFTFDFVQPEIASSVEVIKSPMADMDEGGLSGTININTISPLDYDERKIVISGQDIYTEIRDDHTPKINLAYVDQFMDGKLGVMANVGRHEVNSRYDIVFVQRYKNYDLDGDGATPDIAEDGLEAKFPKRLRYRRTDRDSERILLNGAVQYIFNEDLETKLSVTYVEEEAVEHQRQLLIFFGDNDTQTTALGRSGSSVNYIYSENAKIDTYAAKLDTKRDTGAYTWDTHWTPRDDWELDTTVHYTSSLESNDGLSASTKIGLVNATLDFRDYDNPIVSAPGVDISNPNTFASENLIHRGWPYGGWNIQEAEETTFQMDAKRYLNGIPVVSAVKFGLKYRKQEMEKDSIAYNPIFVDEFELDNTIPELADASVIVKNFGDGAVDGLITAYASPDVDAYEAFYRAAGRSPGDFRQHNSFYNFGRDIFSAYTMFEFEGERYRGNIGVRYVNTERDLYVNQQGFVFAPTDDGSIAPVDGQTLIEKTTVNFDYSEWLPSANFVYDVTDDVVLRAAVAKVMVRPEAAVGNPRYGNQISFRENDVEDGVNRISVREGDNLLTAMTANQFDVSAEWYYKEASAVSLGIFYKEIDNQLRREDICPSSYGNLISGLTLNGSGECIDAGGHVWEIERKFNSEGKVTVSGVELGATHLFTELPQPWDGLGVQANFTYLDAEAEDEEVALTDTADKSANFIVFYEWKGFGARMAYNYRGKYVQQGFFGPTGRTVEPRKQLDMSLSYGINDSFSVSFEALNITEDNETAYFRNNGEFQGVGVGGATYQFGFKYHL
jgi:TonB-dependent receptor